MKEKLVTILFSLFIFWTSIGLLFQLFSSDNRTYFILYILGIIIIGGLCVSGFLLLVYPTWLALFIISIVIGINFVIERFSLFNSRVGLLESSAVHADSFFIREATIYLLPFNLAIFWLINIVSCHLLWKQITRYIRGLKSQGVIYVVGATMASMSIHRLLTPSLLNLKRYSWFQGESFIYGEGSYRFYFNWLLIVGLLHLFIWSVLVLSENWKQTISAEYSYQTLSVYSLIVFCTMIVGFYTLNWLTVFLYLLFNGFTYFLFTQSKMGYEFDLNQLMPSFFKKKLF